MHAASALSSVSRVMRALRRQQPVCFGQGNARRARRKHLQHRQQTLAAQKRRQPRTRADAGIGAERRRADHPARTAENHRAAAIALVKRGCAGEKRRKRGRRERLQTVEAEVDVVAGADENRLHGDFARVFDALPQKQALLDAVERDRLRCADDISTECAPGRAVQPAGNIHRDNWNLRIVAQAVDENRRVALNGVIQPRAVERVHHGGVLGDIHRVGAGQDADTVQQRQSAVRQCIAADGAGHFPHVCLTAA